ncbi:MAG TPA: hypothetical protein DC054_00140 [Blastocatellia bacterium]|nr:hypothetical protein [Blastocatellia bacterium]
MKKLKIILVSFAVGLILSIPTVVAMACDPNCAATFTFKGHVCTFMDGGCNADCSVCWCAYNCGPAEDE